MPRLADPLGRSTLLLLGLLLVGLARAQVQLKVTEVYDNTYYNDGWDRDQEQSRAAVEARLVEEGYNVTFNPVANLTDAQAYTVMDADAASGTSLFVVHNVRFKNSTTLISQKYTTARFITTPSVGQYGGNRTYQMYYNFYQGGWMAGVTCALMSKTGKVGILANSFMRGAVGAHNAFFLGARSVNASIQVVLVQIDDVSNAVEELQTARLLVRKYGVDCGLGGPLINGYQGFAEQGAYSVGIFGFDRYTVGDLCLGTIALDFSSLLYKGVQGALNGTWPGGQTDWGVMGDVVQFASLSPLIPPQTRRRIEAEVQRVSSGQERIFCGDRVASLYPSYAGNASACLPDAQIRTMARWLPEIYNPENVTYNGSLVIAYAQVGAADGYSIFIFLMVAIWNAILLALALFLARHWESRAIIRKSPAFLSLILAGSSLMSIAVLLQYGKPTTAGCQTQLVLVALGFVLVYGSAAAKNWRIYYIFSNKELTVFKINNGKLFLVTLAPVLVLVILFLLLEGLLSPFSAVQTRLDSHASIERVDIICASSNSAMEIVLFITCLLVLLSAALVALRTRNLNKSSKLAKPYNESLQLGMACLIVALYMIALAIVFLFNSATTVSTRAIVLTILIMVPAVVMPVAAFLDLVMGWVRGTLEDTDTSGTSPNLTSSSPRRGGTSRGSGSKGRGGGTRSSAGKSESRSNGDSNKV
jgi:basic membrane lipoprotein Med (substrate-binding protein (PBP1-ABC) superfamily)